MRPIRESGEATAVRTRPPRFTGPDWAARLPGGWWALPCPMPACPRAPRAPCALTPGRAAAALAHCAPSPPAGETQTRAGSGCPARQGGTRTQGNIAGHRMGAADRAPAAPRVRCAQGGAGVRVRFPLVCTPTRASWVDTERPPLVQIRRGRAEIVCSAPSLGPRAACTQPGVQGRRTPL